MIRLKEEYKDSDATVNVIINGRNIRVTLASVTKSQLIMLHEIGHPAVEDHKEVKKEATKKEASKKSGE